MFSCCGSRKNVIKPSENSKTDPKKNDSSKAGKIRASFEDTDYSGNSNQPDHQQGGKRGLKGSTLTVDKKSPSSHQLNLNGLNVVEEPIPRLMKSSQSLASNANSINDGKASSVESTNIPHQTTFAPTSQEAAENHQREKKKILVSNRLDVFAAMEEIKNSTSGVEPQSPAAADSTDQSDNNSVIEKSGSIYEGTTPGPGGSAIDIDNIISRLLQVRILTRLPRSLNIKNNEILAICQMVREVFLSQPMLVELQPPVKIVGDIHGQYLDLLSLFDTCGYPNTSNYLFLGDYVDRGRQSLETILLLFCYKLKYPENFFLLRGNHECASINRVYGFYDECKRRCNVKCWKSFTDVFNVMPVCAIVGDKIFCVHGGLSPGLSSMRQILQIQRPTDIPDFGILNDLLWSDPSETTVDWEENDRGVSYLFGKSVVDSFLNNHQLDLICRAHTVVEDGYEFFNDRTLVTVFSAPNYCGEFDNYGAVMSVDEKLVCSFQLLRKSHPLYKIKDDM